MTRPIGLLAALLAAVLLASACSKDDPKPNFSSVSTTPTTNPSATISSTRSPDPTANVPSGALSPTEPPTAAENSSDGAFAFVAYYWKQLDWAYSTVNGDAIKDLYAPTCKSCESSRSAINDVQAKGNTFRGGHLTIKSQALGATDADPSAAFAIDTQLAVEALSELSPSGAQVATYPAKTYTVRAFVAWSADHFVVTATANLGAK